MDKINVLVVIAELERNVSGSVVMDYLKYIDKDRFRLDILVCNTEESPLEDDVAKLGGRLFKIDGSLSESKLRAEIMKIYMSNNGYQVLHSFLEESSPIFLEISAQLSIPIRIVHALSATGNGTLKKIRVNGFATDLFACNKKTAECLFGKVEIGNVHYMNNPVDIEKFQYNDDVSLQVKNEIGIPTNSIVFTSIGRMSNVKNQEYVLEVFHELKEINNAFLLFVGNGDNKKENNLVKIISKQAARYGIEDRIKFLGVRSDINRVLSATDIMIMPSKLEGFPVSLLEAQACGVKIFVSDTITTECNITDTIEYISLKKPSKFWACEIMNYIFKTQSMYTVKEHAMMRRKVADNNCTIILRKGYDVVDCVKKVQKYYIEALERIQNNKINC